MELVSRSRHLSRLLMQCADKQNVLGGRIIHAHIVKNDFQSDIFLRNSVVNMYAKCGRLEEAKFEFSGIKERDVVSWNCLINGFCQHGRGFEVLGFFHSMRREGLHPNPFTFAGVITSAANATAACEGRQVHCLVLKSEPEYMEDGQLVHTIAIKTGLESHVSVGNALVTMYSKCGNLDDAIRVFGGSNDRNAITWSAMITGFAQGGSNSEALKLFSKMHFSGIKPSEFTLVGVLNACSNMAALEHGKQIHDYMLKLGFASQVYVRSALIDMYAKCGSVNDARKEFDQLKEPDIVLWTSMISGYVQNAEGEEALNLYGRMEAENIRPNELTLSSVIKACSLLAALEQGKQMHARTMKYGLGLQVPIGSALSSMYAKCGDLEEGILVFRRIAERDVVSWNAMISGLSQNGRGKEALQLFEEMHLEGTKPDEITFVNLLSTCSHIGMVDKGWHYFKSMRKDHGIVPRVEHYACMVDILSRAGQLEEAKSFIESVPVEHGMALWRILLGASRSHGNLIIGAYAGERLMELGSQESSAYVLLSNIYASAGRWEDVERVRSMMRYRGVNKEPGCSWIEIKNQVHVFVVRDQLHPQIKEVYAVVRSLSKQMRDEGYRPNTNLLLYGFEHQMEDD
ncbi:pentatricopeptide repeat-containing protein At2g33680 isoform X2 [Nymphaea colorata]|uniref:pentatricopeptide repeat-containing protein At2g33680 isoform X2 n=1 Tax=Nymphaea colorata TaxID=210225 RepID=UPI00129E62AF|nr:pentatricopeptide repeat-containing protein At2g33680 isoform X2 [Nymphaea colorata]